ncbi:MAG: excinuclease ABC subunit UvrA, partial [Candidatus Omnitrophica bacterium]|nr:excinuclease ABC subunit UvrA [Candidatus Omnitrophota bacterium]
MEIDPRFLIPDPSKPWINAIAPWHKGKRGYMMYYRAVLRELAEIYHVDPYTPYQKLNKSFKKIILDGSSDEIWGRRFEGVPAYLERMFRDTDNDWLKSEISNFLSISPCPECGGARLKKESL